MRLILLASWFVCTAALAEPRCPVVERPPYAPWVFLGYLCSGPCLAQKQGFAWAERNGIADRRACTSGAPGFVEGCRAYAESAVTAELAGFEWARENELGDRCACSGAGPAFRDGCAAYVEMMEE
jgi:hypothetical protein